MVSVQPDIAFSIDFADVSFVFTHRIIPEWVGFQLRQNKGFSFSFSLEHPVGQSRQKPIQNRFRLRVDTVIRYMKNPGILLNVHGNDQLRAIHSDCVEIGSRNTKRKIEPRRKAEAAEPDLPRGGNPAHIHRPSGAHRLPLQSVCQSKHFFKTGGGFQPPAGSQHNGGCMRISRKAGVKNRQPCALYGWYYRTTTTISQR